PRSVRLWDLTSGREVVCFTGHAADVTAVAFSPDGAHLVGALTDSSILVWAVPAAARAPHPRSRALAAETLDGLWADLAGDGRGANRAVWPLARAPRQSLPLLRARLRPVPAANESQVRRWLADLDNRRFAVRQAAVRHLERLNGQGEAIIQGALKGDVS